MEINSKGIRWIRYDERTRTLDVAYTNSGEYRYFDVGPEVYCRHSGNHNRVGVADFDSPSSRSIRRRRPALMPNKPLVPTRTGGAPLLAAKRRR
jgi:hypothetical protein